MNKKEQQIYVSPKVKTIEILTRKVLCQSGEIDSMTRDGDGGELFN